MNTAQGWDDLRSECVVILEQHEARRRLTISEIEKHTGAARATLKLRLKFLLEKGLIERHGKGRGTWYSQSLGKGQNTK